MVVEVLTDVAEALMEEEARMVVVAARTVVVEDILLLRLTELVALEDLPILRPRLRMLVVLDLVMLRRHLRMALVVVDTAAAVEVTPMDLLLLPMLLRLLSSMVVVAILLNQALTQEEICFRKKIF